MLRNQFRHFSTCRHSNPKSAARLVGAVGATSAFVGIAPRHCEMESVSAASAEIPVISRLRNKLSDSCTKKADEKIAIVHEAEKKLLDRMPAGTEYETLDVKVHVKGFGSRCSLLEPETEFSIHTVIVGKEHTDKVPIVLVHGFMMGAGSFWKLLPELARERTVYAIDVIGMAGSSRPVFDPNSVSPEEIEEMLCEPFHRWAHAMKLERFSLLGHSFGGLVCAYWATRHPERVACLGLLSPCLGFSEEKINKFKNMMDSDDTPWRARAFFSLVHCVWSHHITPQTLVRWVPGFKGWIGRSTERRYQGMSSGVTAEEGKLLSEYVVATMDTPASTEAACPALFEPFLKPVEVAGGSIKSRLTAMKDVATFAIYGDRDWMEKPAQEEMPNCEFLVMKDSGHHLALDAPEELARAVLPRLDRIERT